MPVFQISNDSIQPIPTTTFPQHGILERKDIQSCLKSRIDVISPDTFNKTYVLSSQWGNPTPENAAESLRQAFPNLNILFRPTGA